MFGDSIWWFILGDEYRSDVASFWKTTQSRHEHNVEGSSCSRKGLLLAFLWHSESDAVSASWAVENVTDLRV